MNTRNPEPQPVRDVALKLLAKGISVIPIPYREKASRRSWKRYQTELATEEQVRSWWANGPSNYGIVTGSLSGIVAIDADSAEAAEYVEKTFPTPWTVRTAKGKHFVYSHPRGHVQTKAGLNVNGFKLDVRADGGYIVGPFSLHPNGVVYAIPADKPWTACRKEDLPLFPAEILRAPEKSPKADLTPGRLKLIDRAKAYLVTAEPPVEGQGSDDKTYRILGRLMGHGKDDIGLTAEEVLPLLEEWQPEFDHEWWLEKIASFEKYGQRSRAESEPSEGITAFRADSIVAEPVEWLWEPRIPLGCLTMFEGDPGVGKGLVLARLAERVSRGTDGFRKGDVLWFSAEDAPKQGIKPRLLAAETDCSNVHIVPGIFALDNGGHQHVRDLVSEIRPRLVIFDPIDAYISGETNTNSNNEVRQLLSPLNEIASEFHTAMLLLRHLTKGNRDKSIYRGAGSIAFTAAARSALLAGKSKNGQRALFHIKCNVGPQAEPLGYAVEPCSIDDIKTARAVFTDAGGLTEADILGPDFDESPNERSALDAAKELLREILKDGPKTHSEICDEARKNFIETEGTLNRAKRDLAVESRRVGRQWFWLLPGQTLPEERAS